MLTTTISTVTNAAGTVAAGAQYIKIEVIAATASGPTIGGVAFTTAGDVVELPFIPGQEDQHAALAYDASLDAGSTIRLTVITD